MPGPTLNEVRAKGQPPEVLARLNDEHWFGRLYMRKLSPYATFKSLTADDRERLLDAITFVMDDGLENERKIESGYPTKKTKHWMVHNKYGQPCPVCETTLERVSYASHEVTYCPTCQTGGKVLADRRTSRFLK